MGAGATAGLAALNWMLGNTEQRGTNIVGWGGQAGPLTRRHGQNSGDALNKAISQQETLQRMENQRKMQEAMEGMMKDLPPIITPTTNQGQPPANPLGGTQPTPMPAPQGQQTPPYVPQPPPNQAPPNVLSGAMNMAQQLLSPGRQQAPVNPMMSAPAAQVQRPPAQAQAPVQTPAPAPPPAKTPLSGVAPNTGPAPAPINPEFAAYEQSVRQQQQQNLQIAAASAGQTGNYGQVIQARNAMMHPIPHQWKNNGTDLQGRPYAFHQGLQKNLYMDDKSPVPVGAYGGKGEKSDKAVQQEVTEFNRQHGIKQGDAVKNIDRRAMHAMKKQLQQQGYNTDQIGTGIVEKSVMKDGIEYKQKFNVLPPDPETGVVPEPVPMGDAIPNLPENYRMKEGEEGGIEPIPMSKADPAHPLNWSEAQKENSGFSSRMVRQESLFTKLYDQNTDKKTGKRKGFDPTSKAMYAYFNNYRLASNSFMTPAERQYAAGAMDFIRANLRKQSGAVIGDNEMASEFATYFPIPGDDEQTIRNKRDTRVFLTQQLIQETGAAYQGGAIHGVDDPLTQEEYDVIPHGDYYVRDDGRVVRRVRPRNER